MKLVKIFIALGFITAIGVKNASCQNNPATFKEIEFALYTVNTPDDKIKDIVKIDLYATITPDGLIKISRVNDRLNNTDYYVYRLGTDALKKIGEVFNEKNELRNFLSKTKLEPGVHYAGQYEYFSVKYFNGKADSISYITPLMSERFNTVAEILEDGFYNSKKRKPAKEVFPLSPALIDAILASYKSSKYLPAITYPPPPAK